MPETKKKDESRVKREHVQRGETEENRISLRRVIQQVWEENEGGGKKRLGRKKKEKGKEFGSYHPP